MFEEDKDYRDPNGCLDNLHKPNLAKEYHEEQCLSPILAIGRESWDIGLTPESSISNAIQHSLDWWHNLPVQNLRSDHGWANLCIKYFPDKTECYHLTEVEVFHVYEQEHLLKLKPS